jgi:hypothetical protein
LTFVYPKDFQCSQVIKKATVKTKRIALND